MRMKRNLWSLLAIFMVSSLCLGLAACGGDDDDDPSPELKVSPTSLRFAATDAEGQDFDITCNTNWTIDVDEDWVEVSSERGNGDDNIEVNVEDNTDEERRTANITVTAGSLSRKVRVTQEAGQSLSVSPADPQLGAEKGATNSFTVSANSSWSVSGVPSWLQLSATSGSNTTTITMTTTEINFNDQPRSATLTVTAGTKTATVNVTQLAYFDSSISVNLTNPLIMSNGMYADLSFSNVLGYHEGLYYKYAFDVKTEEDIYNEIIEETPFGSDEYNYAVMTGLNANTDYVYCLVPYSGDSKSRKYGKMLVYNFTTKSSSVYCDATLTGSYSSSYWTYTVTKQRRCAHYYMLYSTDQYAEYWHNYIGDASVLLALQIRNHIEDKQTYPNYDYYLNGGTTRISRESGDYAFFLWTWGVDDTGEFSGNISSIYANTSSSAKPATAKKAAAKGKVKKMKRSELNKMMSHLRVIEK